MKFIALVLLAGSLGAQTKHPIATKKDSKQIGADLQTKPAEKPQPIMGFATSDNSIVPDVYLSLSDAVDAETGIHTLTISDPHNHWRCVITSTVPVHPGNQLHSELSSFTMTCFDVTSIEPAPTK